RTPRTSPSASASALSSTTSPPTWPSPSSRSPTTLRWGESGSCPNESFPGSLLGLPLTRPRQRRVAGVAQQGKEALGGEHGRDHDVVGTLGVEALRRARGVGGHDHPRAWGQRADLPQQLE